MLLAAARCECEVDDSSCEFRQHLVAQLAVIKSRVLPQHCKPAIEDLLQISKVVAVIDNVLVALAVVPRAIGILAHGGNLHNHVDFCKPVIPR